MLMFHIIHYTPLSGLTGKNIRSLGSGLYSALAEFIFVQTAQGVFQQDERIVRQGTDISDCPSRGDKRFGD